MHYDNRGLTPHKLHVSRLSYFFCLHPCYSENKEAGFPLLAPVIAINQEIKNCRLTTVQDLTFASSSNIVPDGFHKWAIPSWYPYTPCRRHQLNLPYKRVYWAIDIPTPPLEDITLILHILGYSKLISVHPCGRHPLWYIPYKDCLFWAIPVEIHTPPMKDTSLISHTCSDNFKWSSSFR